MDSFDEEHFYNFRRQKNIPKGWYGGLNRLMSKYGISTFGLAAIFSVTEQTVINWLNFDHYPNTSNANLIVTIVYLLDNPNDATMSMKNMRLIRNETLWHTSIKLLSESKDVIDNKKDWKNVEKDTVVSFATSLINISNLLREALSVRTDWFRKNLFLIAVLGQEVK